MRRSLFATIARSIPGLDFDDSGVNRLLGLDTAREAALAWVDPAGAEGPGPIVDVPSLPEPLLRASRAGNAEAGYPRLRKIHEQATSVHHPEEQDVPVSMVHCLGPEPSFWSALPRAGAWPSGASYAETVQARRSSRNFSREPISSEAFSLLTSALAAGGKDSNTYAVVGLGLLLGRVEGTPPGFYLADPGQGRFGAVRTGELTSRMARICLDQDWAAGAALGLGCCGIGAFFDGEAQELLRLGNGSRLLYMVAVGPVQGGLRRRTSG